MSASVWYILGGVALFTVLQAVRMFRVACRSYARSMRATLDPSWSISPLDADSAEFASVVEEAAWPDARGFEFVGAFSSNIPGMPPCQFGAWFHPDDRVYFVAYEMQGDRFFDFVTVFDREASAAVTTSSSADAISPSIPPAYKQAFTDCTHDERLARHLDTYPAMESMFARPESATAAEFPALFEESIRVGIERAMSRSFWAQRGAFNYFLGRHRLVNRPVRIVQSKPIQPERGDA